MNRSNKNLGVGFRILKQIDLYLKNIPDNNIINREEAFDLQILQRILTKIRGSQEQIESLIGVYNKEKDIVEDSVLIDLFNEYNDICKFEKSKKCIKEKAKELRVYGYTI